MKHNKLITIAEGVLISTILWVLGACSKGQAQIPRASERRVVYEYSHKYTIDTVLIRVDTPWHDTLSGRWLDSARIWERRDTFWIPFCAPPIPSLPTFILERITYKVGRLIK